MKIFLDTANRELIKKLVPTGLVDGITTNPTNLSKEGSNTKQILHDICSMVEGPVSIEVVEKAPDKVFEQAREIAQFAPNVVVKIPFAQEYMPVIKMLVAEEVKINVTLVFTTLQALMVAKLGVELISPFVGRWDEIGVDGAPILDEIVAMRDLYGFSSDILAASIRSVMHWQKAALTGADVVTLPTAVLEQAMKHPLTDRGIEMFDRDWATLNKTRIFG